MDRALVVPRGPWTQNPQETLERGMKVWHARRTKSVEALLWGRAAMTRLSALR